MRALRFVNCAKIILLLILKILPSYVAIGWSILKNTPRYLRLELTTMYVGRVVWVKV